MSVPLIVVGMVLPFIGSVMILCAAFRKSVGRGLPALFLPGAVLSFMIADWRVAKRGCSVCVLLVALILGVGVACNTREQPGSEPGHGAATPQRARSEPASTAAAPPRSPGDDGAQPSPTQHWMGQAREAGDTERRSEESSGSGDPDQNPQP
jgi:hypothetical protein